MSKIINKNISNQKGFQLLDTLIEDSMCKSWIDNTINVFTSIDNIIYLIYTNKNNSIIFYNLIIKKKINEIKNAHKEPILNFRHFLDKINYRDLILTISSDDNNIKIWNFNNLECIVDIKNINKIGFLFSAYFLNDRDDNKIYIISSNCYWGDSFEPIKIFDFNGEKIKELNDSNCRTFFIDNYYDNKLNINYIIAGCHKNVKSYDYNKNKLYKTYSDDDINNNNDHYSIIIKKIDEIIKIFESSCDGNVRIWNFHSGLLLNKIKISYSWLKGICLWENDYLFVASIDSTIKLIELKNRIIIQDIKIHNYLILTIKEFIHPKYGKCFISHGNNEIKLWTYKK